MCYPGADHLRAFIEAVKTCIQYVPRRVRKMRDHADVQYRDNTIAYIGDDHPRNLPEALPEITMTMSSSVGSFSLTDDDDWGSLFPRVWKGFMSLGPDNRPFTMSIYHQLHCLDAIRVNFVVNGTHAAAHVEHCLNYLRQAILCHADNTIEPAIWMETETSVEPASDGLGVVHTCRDWRALNEFAETHPVIIPP